MIPKVAGWKKDRVSELREMFDGDGVISDEEWEIYKKVRDAKKASDIDDYLFD